MNRDGAEPLPSPHPRQRLGDGVDGQWPCHAKRVLALSVCRLLQLLMLLQMEEGCGREKRIQAMLRGSACLVLPDIWFCVRLASSWWCLGGHDGWRLRNQGVEGAGSMAACQGLRLVCAPCGLLAPEASLDLRTALGA